MLELSSSNWHGNCWTDRRNHAAWISRARCRSVFPRQIRAEFLKYIIAFANTRDGGYIVVGVTQSGGKFVPEGVSQEQASSFDPTNIGVFAQNYCSALPTVTVNVVRLDDTDLVLLRIDEFEHEPIVCTKDLHDSKGKGLVLRSGSIYVRTADARCVAIDSGEAMRAFLDLAVQKRGEGLLRQIRRLVGPAEPTGTVGLPRAYDAEIRAAAEMFDREEINDPYWHLELMPVSYIKDRISRNGRLKEIRRESVVSIRGWDFPHVDRERDYAFESGIESITHWSRYQEAHRTYRSGLFAWRRRLTEDSSDEFRGSLSYVSSIYSLTELFIFASRYIPLVSPEEELSIRLGVTGLSGRVLRSEPGIFMEDFSTAAAKFEQSYRQSFEEIVASHLDFAADAAQRLFELYNVDISRDVIKNWQERFISRRF